MTLITPEEGPSIEETQVSEFKDLMADLAETLRIARLLIADGDASQVTHANKALSDLRTAWMRAKELEVRFEDERKRRAGVSEGYALDLGAARSQIGCRLAKLRAAKCCRRVS